MDAAVPSDLQRSGLVPPVRGTHTRAVREYEETIDVLTKENFDLKLRNFLLEETLNKFSKNKVGDGPNDVIVNIELKTELEGLRDELGLKTRQLKKAVDCAEKYAADLKELQEKFAQVQEQLSEHAELPSKQEIILLRDENNNLLKEIEFLNGELSEKDNELQEANGRLEALSNINTTLETKVKKSSVAIQGLALKYHQDTKEIPKDIIPLVHAAIEAAKSNRVEKVNTAVESLKAYLFQLMQENVSLVGTQSNIKDVSSGSQEGNEDTPSAHLRRGLLNQSLESVIEAVYVGTTDSREDLGPTIDVAKENLSLKADNQEKSKIISDLTATCNNLEQKNKSLESDMLEAISKIKNLEISIEEKSKSSRSLSKTSASVQTAVQWDLLQSTLPDKSLQNAGSSDNIGTLKEKILMLQLVIKQKDKVLSDMEQNISSLQSQLKDVPVKETSTVTNIDYVIERNELQQKLSEAASVNNELIKHLRNLESFMEDLLQHKNLDSTSMENLQEASDFLSHCLDQTMKLSHTLSDNLSACESSKIFDPNDISLSKEGLNQSALPSFDETRLTKQSFSTSSIPFDPEGRNRYDETHPSKQGLSTSSIPIKPESRNSYNETRPTKQRLSTSSITSSLFNPQGRNGFQSSVQETLKNTVGTGKKRLSFSTQHKSSLNIDKENVVVLGTSNNEDLILFLNDRGHPEDVVIRNNCSQLDHDLSGGDRLCRQGWESTSWNGRQVTHLDKLSSSWGTPRQLDPKKSGSWYNHCPSSDSDIWSEPDRDISLQRIGIDVQKSPVAQKSPRRSRLRDKRTTDELSSQRNESSSSFSKLHSWSKRRKSSESSPVSYICKKCLSESHQVDDTDKDKKDELIGKISELSRLCSSQDSDLIEMRQNLNSKIDLIDTLSREKEELSSSVRRLKEELSVLRQKTPSSERSKSSLIKVDDNETDKLKNTIKELEAKVSEYDAECDQLKTELGQTKSRLEMLDAKCCRYEQKLSLNFQGEDEYLEKLQTLDAEKIELQKKIEDLISEKNNLLDSIKFEKKKNSQNVSFQKIPNLSSNVAEASTSTEERVLSPSTSVYDALKNELGNVKSTCAVYEKELGKSSETQQNIIDKLSSAQTGFISNLNALNDVCRKYLAFNGNFVDDKDSTIPMLSQLNKDEQIEKLLKALAFIREQYEQVIVLLSQHLDVYQSQQSEIGEEQIQSLKIQNNALNFRNKELQECTEENRFTMEEYKSKISSHEQELEWRNNDLQSLKEDRDKMQASVRELKLKNESAEEKYKSIIVSLQQQLEEKVNEIQSLKVQDSQLSNNIEQLQQDLGETRLSDQENISKIDTYRNELQGNQNTIKYLEECRNELKVQVDEMQSQNKSSEDKYASQVSNIQQQLEAKESEIHSLEIRNHQISENMELLQQNKEEAKHSVEEYKSKILTYQQELESNQNDIKSLMEEKKQLKTCNEELEQQYKSYKEECKIKISTTEHDLTVKKNEIQTLSIQNDQLNRRSEELQKIVEEAKSSTKEWESKILFYQQELEMNKNNIESLTDEKNELQTCVTDLQSKIKSAEEKYISTVESLQQKLELKEADVQSMQIQNNLLNANIKELSENIEECKSKFISCQKDLESSQKVVQLLTQNKDELLAEVEDIQRQSKYSTEEHESKINLIQQQLDMKRNEKESLNIQNNQLNDTVKNLLQNVEETKHLHAEYKSKLTSSDQDLKSSQSKIEKLQQKNKSLEENYRSQLTSVQNQLELKNIEIQSMTGQNHQLNENIDKLQQNLRKIGSDTISRATSMSYHELLNSNQNDLKALHRIEDASQHHIDELQQVISDKDRQLEIINLNVTSTQKQVNNLQKQAEKDHQLLNMKDDEITQLQERIFNMQTQISGLLSKMSLASRGAPEDMQNEFGIQGSISTSWSSVSDKDTESPKKSTEQYLKKIKSLESKQVMSEQRIKILEKEKNDMREVFHSSKLISGLLEPVSSTQEELADLKAKLEAKTSFINDLKAEYFKTCNALIEKQKEVDELSRYKRSMEGKLHGPVADELKIRFSDPLHSSTESSIKELKKHKWDLIQEIFTQQKLFYERKNIHVGHFEKFRNHIENLRDLQSPSSLFKSGSEPLLNDSRALNRSFEEKCDDTLQNWKIELEIDIECLQNFKIFLKRFFIPLVLQASQTSKSGPKNDYSDLGTKLASSQQRKDVSVQTKTVSDEKASRKGLVLRRSSAYLHSSEVNYPVSLITIACSVSSHLDFVESSLSSVKTNLQQLNDSYSTTEETPRKNSAKTILQKMFQEVNTLKEKTELFSLNSTLKKLGLFEVDVLRSPSKQVSSGAKPLTSEETIALSRSGSLSPMSLEEEFHSKIFGVKSLGQEPGDHSKRSLTESKTTSNVPFHKSSGVIGGSLESLFLRSISSPDLGIESDPNHESSAPEQMEKEDFRNKMSKRIESGSKGKQPATAQKQPSSAIFIFDESATKTTEDISNITFCDTLHAIGMLPNYELLKKEVQESLVGIKVILSRTGDGLQRSKHASPRKSLEYTTFKAIRDQCSDIETCLQEATKLVGQFWIAPCPSVEELNMLIQQNHKLQEKLRGLKEAKRKQEGFYKDAMDKLKNAEVLRENMEKKISKKLVKTKNVIRQAQLKMIERKNQSQTPIPKYPDSGSANQGGR